MTVEPRSQFQNDVVFVDEWDLYTEAPFLQGRKPKRVVVCPDPAPKSYLIGGHRYVFKTPEGSKVQQIWSEVIAYHLGTLIGVPVPPAFLAYDRVQDKPGVLVEFFYGHSHLPARRFVHAIERFQAYGTPVDFRRGSLRDNVLLSRAHKVTQWKKWWARTIAFDALIANSDRHSENWGFLISQESDVEPTYSMSPVFDNGTSLNFIIQDKDLPKFLTPNRLKRLAEDGTHHFGWLSGNDHSAQHARLCAMFANVFGSSGNTMGDVIHFPEQAIDDFLYWCTEFDFAVRFVPERASLISQMLRIRRDAISQSLR